MGQVSPFDPGRDANTHSYTGERTTAIGNETGLLREWLTQFKGQLFADDLFSNCLSVTRAF